MTKPLSRKLLSAIGAALDAALAGDGFDGGDFAGLDHRDFEVAREWVTSETGDDDGSMTAEEIRLENLKQMAAYSGPIVSFECREPYYLASCDHCGWVGSSELCGTDSFGDDSDVYCPRCHASGADYGKVAAALSGVPAGPLERMFSLRWTGAPRPPVHPQPMNGSQGFPTFVKALAFMQRQPIDAEFVSLTEYITEKVDRTEDARAALERGFSGIVAALGEGGDAG